VAKNRPGIYPSPIAGVAGSVLLPAFAMMKSWTESSRVC
jgi:hypothetical protein